MSTTTRLAAFATALTVALAAGYGLGAAVGPLAVDGPGGDGMTHLQEESR